MEQYVMYGFDLFGTMVFAVTGAVRGIKNRLDFLGVIVLSCTVGVGGGMLRDCLIGAVPVAALKDESYLILCIMTGGLMFYFGRHIAARRNAIQFCDAVGLGVFTAIGAAKGVAFHLSPVGIVLSGVLTAIGGGVLRDIMVGRIPSVLKSDFYATASLIGGLCYCLLEKTSLTFFTKFMLVALLVTGARMLAIHFGIQLPVASLRRHGAMPDPEIGNLKK